MMQKKDIVTLLLEFFLTTIISSGFALSNSIGLYIVYLSPLVIILFALQMCIDKHQYSYNKRTCRYVTLAFTMVICCPLFLGIFYGIFHPLFSPEFERVENCQVIGIAPMNEPDYDNYTILYVNFEYDSQTFLGYACLSDKPQIVEGYHFMYKDEDSIPCNINDKSYDMPVRKQRFLGQENQIQIIKNEKNRNLRERRECQQLGRSIFRKYNFSQVKLPVWMCLEKNSISFEELTKSQKCFINFHKDRDRSYQNSKNRLNLKDLNFFALTVFEYPFYYPKAGYFCLIALTFIPLHLNYYYFIKKLSKPFCNSMTDLRNKYLKRI